MADATIELGVKPVLDLQYTKKLMDSLEKELRSVRGGTHKALTQKLSTVMQQMVASGEATTATQARIALADMLGARFSPQAKGILRRAQNQAQIELNKEKAVSYAATQLKRAEQKQEANLSSAYDAMMMRYEVFKGTPSESNRDKLLGAVLHVDAQLANLSKDRKTEIKNIAKIEKDTRAIGKEASEFKFAKPAGSSAVHMLRGMYKGALGLLGIGTVWGAIKTMINKATEGVKEGYNDLVEQSVYGQSRDIAGTRSLSKMYGIKEESLVGAEHYALDFRQRMMMGEVSDREFIALSKMGSLGQMVVSGEAGKNPERFQKALQDYIRANKGNEAEVRQNLRYLGLNPDIMAYGALEHTADRESMIKDEYEKLVRENKISAVSTLIPSQIQKTVGDEIKSVLAGGARKLFSGPESEAFLYRSLQYGTGFKPSEVSAYRYELEKRRNEFGFDPGNWLANAMTVGMRSDGNIGIALYERAVQNQVVATKEGTRDGAKEGAKEGIIEGLESVLRDNTSHSSDRTIMGMMNITAVNREAS